MNKTRMYILRYALLVVLFASCIAPTVPVESESLSAEEFSRMIRDFSEEGGYFMSDNFTSSEDSYLTMLGPHMHYRGFDADFSVVYPDGREEKLLNVPNYQFNWQTTYDFKEPLFLPGGSELIFNATFDNSEMNPFNPDPTIEISWGEQTWQEMFFGFYQYYEADK